MFDIGDSIERQRQPQLPPNRNRWKHSSYRRSHQSRSSIPSTTYSTSNNFQQSSNHSLVCASNIQLKPTQITKLEFFDPDLTAKQMWRIFHLPLMDWSLLLLASMWQLADLFPRLLPLSSPLLFGRGALCFVYCLTGPFHRREAYRIHAEDVISHEISIESIYLY